MGPTVAVGAASSSKAMDFSSEISSSGFTASEIVCWEGLGVVPLDAAAESSSWLEV
jgi:hypothetical protein